MENSYSSKISKSVSTGNASHVGGEGAKSLPAVPVLKTQDDDISQEAPAEQTLAPIQKKDSAGNVIQLAAYMRALTEQGKIDGEIASLRREFVDETNREHAVNSWVDGFAGMPTARNTGNDKHYFSPVGYKLETATNADVLANYRGDGNTNDIPAATPKWVAAATALHAAVIQVADYTAWVGVPAPGKPAILPDPANFAYNDPRRAQFINTYLTPYLRANIGDDQPLLARQQRTAGQLAVKQAITNAGLDAIRTHYDTRPAAGVTRDRFMGAGVNPEGMDAAVGNADIKYIESILHAKFNQVTSAWYNRSPGEYSAGAAQATWRSGENADWLTNRRESATAIQTAFNAIPGTNVNLEEIGPAPVVAPAEGGGQAPAQQEDAPH